MRLYRSSQTKIKERKAWTWERFLVVLLRMCSPTFSNTAQQNNMCMKHWCNCRTHMQTAEGSQFRKWVKNILKVLLFLFLQKNTEIQALPMTHALLCPFSKTFKAVTFVPQTSKDEQIPLRVSEKTDPLNRHIRALYSFTQIFTSIRPLHYNCKPISWWFNYSH